MIRLVVAGEVPMIASSRLLLVLVSLAWGGAVFAAAPPPRLTEEQARRVKKLERLLDETDRSQRAGDLGKATQLAREALDIERAVFGEVRGSKLPWLEFVASAHEQRKEFAQAVAARQEVLRQRERLHGASHWRTNVARVWLHNAKVQAGLGPAQRQQLARARALLASAVGLRNQRRSADALRPTAEAVGLFRETVGEKHLDYANILHLQAQLYFDLGQYARGIPLREQVIAIVRELFGEEHALYAVSLHNLALLCQDSGDYARALPLYEEALRLLARTEGVRSLNYSVTMHNLADLYHNLGQPKRGLPLMRRALPLYKELKGERDIFYVQFLQTMAALYRDMRRFVEAMPLQQRAVELSRQIEGPRSRNHEVCLHNLARLYHQMGQYPRALRLYQGAVGLAREMGRTKGMDYTDNLINLGQIYLARGDRNRALPLLSRVLDERLEDLGELHPGYARALNHLALAYQGGGDYARALPFAGRSVALIRRQLDRITSVQSEQQQLRRAWQRRYSLDIYLSLSRGAPGLASTDYTEVLAWKGAVLARQQLRRLTMRSADARTQQLLAELQGNTTKLAALTFSRPPPNLRAQRRQQQEALQMRVDELEAELSRQSTSFRAYRAASRLRPADMEKLLPAGTVLVDFLAYGHHDAAARPPDKVHEPRLLAFVLRPGSGVVRIELGPLDRIRTAIDTWHKAMLKHSIPDLLAAPGARLRALLWKPLQDHLRDAKVVLISPDDALCRLPFAALPGSTKGTFLLEDVAVAVVPVPRLLPELLAAPGPDRKPAPDPSLLLVGNVDFDRASAGSLSRGRAAPSGVLRKWVHLGETKAEAAAVKKRFQQLFREGHITSLARGEPSKPRVRQELGRHRFVHLATHGFFAPPELRSILDTPNEREGPAGPGGASGWHPLLLSGIALAGANREPKPGEEDGILTALEVSEMDLGNVELAVLSACETGLGKEAGGEGLLGLQRAFQGAGARSVVASLWQVDDRATSDLMVAFYEHMWDRNKKLSRVEALRQAQRAVLRKGKTTRGGLQKKPAPDNKGPLPPYYWAAFVLSGDWR
jgi:CHAT domain-containing protein